MGKIIHVFEYRITEVLVNEDWNCPTKNDSTVLCLQCSTVGMVDGICRQLDYQAVKKWKISMLTANDFLYQQYRAYCHYVPLEDVCVLFVIVRNCTDIWFSGGFGGSPFPSSSRWSQRGRSSSCLKLGIHLQGDCLTFDNCTTIAHELAGASLAVLCPSCCQCQSLSNALLFEPLEPTTMSTSYITSPAETKFFCTSYCCLCPSVTTSLSYGYDNEPYLKWWWSSSPLCMQN